jgi:hypothetical protein
MVFGHFGKHTGHGGAATRITNARALGRPGQALGYLPRSP